MTDFEKHLSQVKVRPIPIHWREEILAVAENEKPPLVSALPAFPTISAMIRRFLWPHPAAWAALAACWFVVIGLCFSGPRGPELYAVTPPGTKSPGITPERYTAYLKARDHFMTLQNQTEPPVLNRRDL